MSTSKECSLWWLVAIGSKSKWTLGGSSSGALHENCGHVPEVKTQPQNTNRITRRITLDYIPLSKGVCQTKLIGEGIENSGNSIEKIAFGFATDACLYRWLYRNELDLGADRYDSWHSGDYLYAICRSCRGDEKAKERIGTISWLSRVSACVAARERGASRRKQTVREEAKRKRRRRRRRRWQRQRRRSRWGRRMRRRRGRRERSGSGIYGERLLVVGQNVGEEPRARSERGEKRRDGLFFLRVGLRVSLRSMLSAQSSRQVLRSYRCRWNPRGAGLYCQRVYLSGENVCRSADIATKGPPLRI